MINIQEHSMNREQTTLQRPITVDRDIWHTYWKAQGQSWRTEPEIAEERQGQLAEYCAVVPDIQKGIYPFKDIKLNRADIEWLLATHEDRRGPIEWNYENQRRGEGLDLRGANLSLVDLHGLPLTCMRSGLNRSEAIVANLEQRHMAAMNLEGANLSLAHLEGANLGFAHLEGANLSLAHLEGADFYGAHFEKAYLKEAYLGGASLRTCFFDGVSNFNDVKLADEKLGCVLLAGVHWNDLSLLRVDWAGIKMLGDEKEARQSKRWDGKIKNKGEWLYGYQIAVQAYRQLAIALQAQGSNEEAANFAYRAHVLQRIVLWHQRKFDQYLFSLFLSLLAGYGYKLWRSFAAYVLVIALFAATYYHFGSVMKISLSPIEAIVFSMTSFHGRGFTPGENIGLSNPLTILAAIEALVGLVIEVTLIATLTQRFFKR
jgi:uncharacterized protein YjbI with pentapeptide repeats